MPLKIPKTVKVGHYHLPIKRVKNLRTQDGSGAWGIWYFNKFEIELESPIPCKDKERETLLHEILHAIVTINHLPVEMPREEELVGRMSLALITLLRDNPKLARYLLDD